MAFLKKLIVIVLVGFLPLVIACILALDILISHKTKTQLYDNIECLPKNKVGLLLGTAKYSMQGGINLYYKYRIQAAVKLYKSGKIDYILASGDNSQDGYNEPRQMQEDLVKAGIPNDRIYLDYAGFRTFDSVVRSKEVFEQKKITIISQPFHNQRALFIANNKGMQAIGYNAQAVKKEYSWRTRIREKFARFKMCSDLLFNRQPKFLGEPVLIGDFSD